MKTFKEFIEEKTQFDITLKNIKDFIKDVDKLYKIIKIT